MSTKANEKNTPVNPRERWWNYWVFDLWEETRDKYNLEEIWAEHRKINASRIPKLEQKAVRELADWMAKGHVPRAVVELAAESMPCEYLEDLEDGIKIPRNSALYHEAETIRMAAIALERALVSASGFTRGEVSLGFFPVPRETKGLPRLPDEMESCRLFFVDGPRPYQIDTQPNPKLIEGLQALAFGAGFVMERTPKDRGGSASGMNDSTGRRAKEHLVLMARDTLRNLGLPSGAHKGGAVSQFVALVHRAATSQSAPWADKFAAMAPKLERKADSPRYLA